ncbi:MAG: ATP-binding protein [Methylacidiphilales bacterium]|nr:ATP-binding protein [Candidatus Methylacidiphilales bacterium]MDW8349293.1 ATP-binding protein [Verrucomicrobiae bacterium]
MKSHKEPDKPGFLHKAREWLKLGARTTVQITYRQRLVALLTGTLILALLILFFAFFSAYQAGLQREVLKQIIETNPNISHSQWKDAYARHEQATRNIQSVTFGALLLLLFFDALMAFLVYKEHIARYALKSHRSTSSEIERRKLTVMQRFIGLLEEAGITAAATKSPALESFIQSCRADKADLKIIEAEEPLVEIHIEMVDELTKKNILTPLVISTNARIQANKNLIKAALRQFVLNAAQAVGSNGKIIFRAYDKFAKFHGHHRRVVYLLIEDNGGGIPEDVQPFLYQHFYSTKDDRLGLGLSIAQRIAEAHGAEIHYETEKGVGSSFALVLPAVEEDENEKIAA